MMHLHSKHAAAWPVLAAVAVIAALGLVLAGCGDDNSSSSTSTPAGARTAAGTPGSGEGGGVASVTPSGTARGSALCASIEQLGSSITSLTAAGSIEDLKTAAQQVSDSADEVKTQAQEAKEEGSDDLESAIDDFKKSLDDATSSDNPGASTLAALATAITSLGDQLQQARANGGCNNGGTPSEGSSPVAQPTS